MIPVTAAGCLRNHNDGNGWVFYQNAKHATVGPSSIETTKDAIILRFPGARGVYSFIVTPDNNLAMADITMGISGGGSSVHITLRQAGVTLNPWDVNTTTVPASNIWFIGCQFT